MISIKNKEIEIEINPNLGAGLHKFTFQGKHLLRQTKQVPSLPQEQSLFLMIPYCSYIKNGQFNYFGITRKINTHTKNPIHGDVCQQEWQIINHSENEATLTYTHNKNSGFPFNYQASVRYQINDNQLNITLGIKNLSELPMPAGMGIHPYFQFQKNALVKFESSHIWHHKNDPIFDRPYPTPKEWNFSKGAAITQDFDTAFGGWNGQAEITYPDEKIKIQIQANDIFHHLILYHPTNTDFFCLEPVSNTPDAFNLAAYGVIGTGIQSIGAGQTLEKTITFTCTQE